MAGGVRGEGCRRRREDGEREDVGVSVADVSRYEATRWRGGTRRRPDAGIGDTDSSRSGEVRRGAWVSKRRGVRRRERVRAKERVANEKAVPRHRHAGAIDGLDESRGGAFARRAFGDRAG